jgi:NAD(P)-dependent dehydrogenase (short-subunit alcohol dehydrogenase family)
LQREYHSRPDNWSEDASAQQPFGRLLDPAEVARAAAFLSCDESGMMTGATINFDQSVWGAYDDTPHPEKAL